MPSRPCLKCGVLTSGSYCPRHRPSRESPGRTSGAAQAAFRKRTLAKTGGRCAVAGCSTLFDRVEAHHPLPFSRGGRHGQEGVPLCFSHHRAVTRAEAKARSVR